LDGLLAAGIQPVLHLALPTHPARRGVLDVLFSVMHAGVNYGSV
jgi:hypothetical protein